MEDDLLDLNFDYEGHKVRMVGTQENPEWIAADVCEVLGLSNPRMALAEFVEDEKGVSTIDTLGGPQEMLTVKEKGLYRLIARSRKPEAKRFQDFMFGEVMPSVRRHGCYPAPAALSWAGPDRKIITNADHAIRQVFNELAMPQFQAIHSQIGELRHEVREVKEGQVLILKNQTEHIMSKRRHFTPTVELELCKATRSLAAYQGKCPTCHEFEVVNENFEIIVPAEVEHGDGDRHDNSFENGWIICKSCHDKKHRWKQLGLRKFWWRSRFESFHDHARESGFHSDGTSRKRISDPRQLSIFTKVS